MWPFARRGTDIHTGDPHPDNGRSYESLRTNVARHRTRMYFDIDDIFIPAGATAPVELKVTYRDHTHTSWRAIFRSQDGQTRASPVVRGRQRGRGAYRTATIRLAAPVFDSTLPGGADPSGPRIMPRCARVGQWSLAGVSCSVSA